jgi:small subunit ribosomal protein S1
MVDEKKGGFAELLKSFFSTLPKAGDLVKGKVVAVDAGEVRVDINGIITGVVRGQELFSESREYADLKIGDDVEATVVEPENENGETELSFRAAGHRLVWQRMAKNMEDGITIPAKVVSANRGGLMMQVDALSGFLPVSQLNPDHYPRVPGGDKNRILEHLKSLSGQTMQVKVIDVSEADDKLIVSEKAVWEDDQKAVLESYKVGDTVEGEISALTSFGAFVKFGEGLEGLVHISEIVWQRISHPRDVLKVGDRVKAQIIDINKSKIYLSIKRLVEDPWKKVKDKFKVGDIVEGEIHKIEEFGIMVKLDDEIHGLAHVSELSDGQMLDLKTLREKFKIGEKAKFEVISVEPSEHRLGLRLEGVQGRKVKPVKEVKDEEKVEEAKEEEVKE